MQALLRLSRAIDWLNSQVDGITLFFFEVDHAQGLQGIGDR